MDPTRTSQSAAEILYKEKPHADSWTRASHLGQHAAGVGVEGLVDLLRPPEAHELVHRIHRQLQVLRRLAALDNLLYVPLPCVADGCRGWTDEFEATDSCRSSADWQRWMINNQLQIHHCIAATNAVLHNSCA